MSRTDFKSDYLVEDDFKLERLSLNDSVQTAIVNLRQSEFQSKFQSDVDVQGNRNDAAGTHFGAWSGEGNLVSILRLTTIETPGVYEANMMFPANDPFSDLPCGLLARAATVSECRGKKPRHGAANNGLRQLVVRREGAIFVRHRACALVASTDAGDSRI